jgi:hypothetical protein
MYLMLVDAKISMLTSKITFMAYTKMFKSMSLEEKWGVITNKN